MKPRVTLDLVLLTVTLAVVAVARPTAAQITSGSVAGTVRDSQGGVVPGATITLTSDSRGTSLEVVSSDGGYFVFPIVPPDTYTLKVVMSGFRTLEVAALQVNAGDRRALGTLTIDVGTLDETVVVAGRTTDLQAKSAERSFVVEGEAVQNIAVNGRSFFGLAFQAAGVVSTGATATGASTTLSANGLRPNQNNVQVDGVTTMDTGNNGGPMVSLSLDAVQEIKILTSNYQAEYGRSAGAQISAVTKSGGQTFHGSLYALRRDDDLNANTWFNKRAVPQRPTPPLEQRDYGYSLGGPLWVPGGYNGNRSRLFFFFNQEYQHRLNAQTAPVRVRLPTELERRGDFSQTLDNAGRPFPYIRDYTTGLPCGPTDTRGCFQDGGVLGRIPPNRLYDTGLNILKMYPTPNSGDTISQGFNHVTQAPVEAPRRQDLVRIDWQPSNMWRLTGKLLQTGGDNVAPYGGNTIGFGTNIPEFGYTDPCRCNRGVSFTGAVTLNNTTFLEVTYGISRNEFSTYPSFPDQFNKTALGLSRFPLLYPDAPQLDMPPRFEWNGRVGNSPRNWTEYAPFLNTNTSQDVVANLTKAWGSHTAKAGLYINHAVKPQSSRAPANGSVSFQNDASNPFDTGFPFANAATGIFQTYSQAAQWTQGHYVYNNVEWYLQDNWKVDDKLTLDYGIRFYWIEPTHETQGLSSNFLPEKYSAAKAPRLYYPAIDANGVRVARDLVTGQTLPAANIGRIIPNSGTLLNGLFPAGQGIDEHLYRNRGVHYAPRLGVAYDVTGTQRVIVRGGFGVFYDRPTGDTVYAMIEQPPTVVAPTLFYGRLQDINSNSALVAPPTLFAFDYQGKVPTTYAFNAGVQVPLPFAAVLDVSYVGSRNRNQLTQQNINAPEYGAAYLPQNQDPTLATSSVPGATALPVDFLRPYRGYGNIFMVGPTAYSDYNALQTSVNRRFDSGVLFTVSYTLSKAMGTSSTDLPAGNNNPNPSVIGFPRNDGNQDQANYMPLSFDRRHSLLSSFVWQIPGLAGGGLVRGLLRDWQFSGVYRLISGDPYTVTYSIPGISPYTLTGTQGLEGARIVIVGDPGSGHSSDPYRQFDTTAFTTPKPGSIGLESGTNYLTTPAVNNLDLSIAKIIRMGGNRRLELRLDAFNALNRTQFLTVNSTLAVRSLTDPTPTNLAYDAAGNLVNPTGFGAVTSTRPSREIQLLARFQF